MIRSPRGQHLHALCGVAVLALAHSGCAAVGPDYQPPVMPTPDAWTQRAAQEVSQGAAASLQAWWTIFEDPVLDALIAEARAQNLDLRVAMSRIRQSRALLAIARGEELPIAVVSASAAATKASDDGPLEQVAPEDGFQTQGLFELGLDAGWEIDVFGRVRRTIEAAGAGYDATVEDYRDVLVTLLAEVALSYVDVRLAQQRIEITRANALEQRESLALAQDRFDSGVSSLLDVAQARYTVAATEASIPPLRISLNQALNRLAVLLGRDAGTLQAEFGDPEPLPAPQESIGIGVPANLLRQRPDIRRAERLLAAQTAEIGVATADLYPSFSLSGFFGLQSRSPGSLFSGSSLTWGLSAPVQWNLFDREIIRSNISLQSERADELLLQYESHVLRAVEEVENAIMAFNLNRDHLRLLQQATAATQEAVDLVLVQYNSGLTEFNNVLVTQEALLVQRQQMVVVEAEIVSQLIALYKALGGGWQVDRP